VSVEPYWTDGQVTLHLGDCVKMLAGMDAASVDAVVTDPPYGLEFMGREWDSFKPSQARIRRRVDDRTNPAEGKSVTVTPESYTAGQPFQAWCQRWAAECLRVLKPGGHLLAFGGTRTYHRLACGIEDAGFEIRDSTADLTGYDAPGLMWLYAQGFPKSLDVSKAIDKAAGAEREVVGPSPHLAPRDRGNRAAVRGGGAIVCRSGGDLPATEDAARWGGWGTALKPGWEPIVVARKPLAGTVAQNVLAHGTGALNVGGCRVEPTGESRPRVGEASQEIRYTNAGGTDFAALPGTRGGDPAGRWPPNVVLGPEAAEELDRQSGVLTSGVPAVRRASGADRDGNTSPAYGAESRSAGSQMVGYGDSGGASRFFPVFRYEAKAGAAERPRLPDGTAHPTVKPVPLKRWLVRLVTPPGGLVCDPFAGSGTTGEACIVEGFRCVLIEKDPASVELIQTRLRKDIQPDMFGGAA
jgi:hypothetical protein